eukprot:gnl/MRDRNA2_/MRDRNA2_186911_c0_seq1.p1 gnl/MRDRNA2_/MRDRNA2_186911_c0~~gnl/MRDRNA2_/MRDRNA2_186911_c0_seq1.p1  ORF type:complete len:145 (+),score=25.96 gnl/MRDRNA2_/MRDRNA2_186911_c0_seq1:85-519(+)
MSGSLGSTMTETNIVEQSKSSESALVQRVPESSSELLSIVAAQRQEKKRVDRSRKTKTTWTHIIVISTCFSAVLGMLVALIFGYVVFSLVYLIVLYAFTAVLALTTMSLCDVDAYTILRGEAREKKRERRRKQLFSQSRGIGTD